MENQISVKTKPANSERLVLKGQKRKHSWYWSLFAIAVMSATVLVVVNALKPKDVGIDVIGGKPQDQKPYYPLVTSAITQVPFDKLPDKFPADIPLEKGAKVVENYNSTLSNGLFHAVRVFETTKSLDDNYYLYEDFFNKNNWTILPPVLPGQSPDSKSISAVKDKIQSNISIEENPISKIKTVTIFVISLP